MESAVLSKAPRAGGRRERTKAQNRLAILAAARQVFAGMGFGAATVRDIIRATPLGAGTFYNYFKSKEDVYQAIRDEAALAVRPSLRAARTQAQSAEAFIGGSFRAFFAFVVANRAELRQLRQAETMAMRMDTPEITAGFAELRADVDDAVARGLLPEIDSDLLMAAMVGAAFEIGDRLLLRDDLTADEAASFAAALFLGGIAALPQKGASQESGGSVS